MYLRSNEVKVRANILFPFAIDNIFKVQKRFLFWQVISNERRLSHVLAIQKFSLWKD